MRERLSAARERPGWIGGQLLIALDGHNQRTVIGTWAGRADRETRHEDSTFTGASASWVLDLCAPTASRPRCSAVGAENSPRRGRPEVVSSTGRDGAETGDTVGVGVGVDVRYYRGADGDQRRGGSPGG
jgi:hypothetical protein